MTSRDGESFVYFIGFGDDGPIKIGRALDPWARRHGLQISFPVQLHLLGIVHFSKWTERAVQARFVETRVRGEWFARTPELLEFIRANTDLDSPWTHGSTAAQADDIRTLGLHVRDVGILRRANIHSVTELRGWCVTGSIPARGIGRGTFARICRSLDAS